MIRYLLVAIMFQVCMNPVFASVNSERYDRVVAAYDFESENEFARDIGPREIHAGLFRGAFKSEESKFGNKSLAFERSGGFQASKDSFLSIFSEASIAFWIKTPEQPFEILIAFGGYDGGENRGITSVSLQKDSKIEITQIGEGTREFKQYETEIETMDNKWHHIVFILDHNRYRLFYDGVQRLDEVALYESPYSDIGEWIGFETPRVIPVYIGYVGNRTFVSIELSPDYYKIEDQILFDDLVFYEEPFSPTDVQELYKNGLKKFLEVMPVDPQAKIATTWGAIKSIGKN